jgi:integrase
VLSLKEIAAILDACAGKCEREHLVRFIVIELGTAGRPEAVLELTHANIDLERNLIDPRQAGRVHARKRRAIVPIAKAVRPWVEGVEGKLIKYKVPIAEKNRVPGGPTHYERETKSIKTTWRAACEDAGVEGATPKTLRHTMLTWLAARKVSDKELEILAGHSAIGTTARNYVHLSPDYLRDAVEQIDAFFDELAKHTKVHLRYAGDTQLELPLAA